MRKTYKPVTPGQRHAKRRVDTEQGSKKVPKELRYGNKKTGGRNNRGRITAFHRGGGFKQLLRLVQQMLPPSLRTSQTITQGEVMAIHYDPRRTARLALINNTNTKPSYILAAEGMKVGDVVQQGQGASPIRGSILYLKDIPIGTDIYSLERQPGQGAKMVRSAGTKATLLRKEEDYVVVRLPSGERRRIKESCTARIGQVGCVDHLLESIGKAGRNRNRGQRPVVRGVAMNPIDHPHGGRTKGGVPTVTPQARVAKGQPTRNKRKASVFIVKSRKEK